ncbi:MAG TPA: fatty acid-binding protein DegV [Firmicutes bacterium]|jgi:DegV family protein with EDD domain|nr:fatty acid-binding protein DegV [Bacillota bacterium]HBT18004.1 fatty acid-binding protein DegV [Bacillota bacterium]
MSIKIVTDSTADLSPELLNRFSIEVIPLSVYFGDQVYLDGKDLSPKDFLEKVKTSQVFPKTAQVAPADFIDLFHRLLDRGHEILFIGISSGLSGTVSSASLAAQELSGAPIAIVDSKNLSMGIGILALHGAEMAEKGAPLNEIAERLHKMVPKIKTSFIVDSLDFLYKGGRLSRTQALIGNVLQIHPRIEVVEGKLLMAEKFRGSKAKANTRLIEWATEKKETIDRRWISVTHCHAHDSAEFIAAELRKMNLAQEVVITQAGAVISSHCGPGTVGILFSQKDF